MCHLGPVQDRYAGDLGDYLKLGLLRWLTSSEADSVPRLGVVWYRREQVSGADGEALSEQICSLSLCHSARSTWTASQMGN
jgi:hypothetical protein